MTIIFQLKYVFYTLKKTHTHNTTLTLDDWKLSHTIRDVTLTQDSAKLIFGTLIKC